MPSSDRAYDQLTSRITRNLDRWEREQWELVFAQQRAVWKAGYERKLTTSCGCGLHEARL
jgi:hypothetical protein